MDFVNAPLLYNFMEYHLYILSIMKTEQCYNETNQKKSLPLNGQLLSCQFVVQRLCKMLGKESKKGSREGRLEIC